MLLDKLKKSNLSNDSLIRIYQSDIYRNIDNLESITVDNDGEDFRLILKLIRITKITITVNVKHCGSVYKYENGNKVSLESRDEPGYKWTYDSNGNNILLEKSSGYRFEQKYDSNNNLIRTIEMERHGRFREQIDYNSNGDIIMFENSTKRVKNTYNSNNQIVEKEYLWRSEDILRIMKYIYNSNGDLLKQYNNDGYFVEYVYDDEFKLIGIKTSGTNHIECDITYLS